MKNNKFIISVETGFIKAVKSKNVLLYLILLIFSIIYLTSVIANHYYFRTFCWDYGVYNNAFWDYAHFRLNSSPIYDPAGVNFLQDHMSFIMFIIAPLYWIFNWFTGTYTLLIIQEIFVIIGGYYVYLLIKHKSQNQLLAIFALVHYFVLQGHYSIFSSDCNITTLGAAIVPVFLYYFERKKIVLASVFFLLVLISKESMSLWLIFICISLMMIHYKDKKTLKYSLIYLMVSLFYFIFQFKFLIPLFEDPNRLYWGFTYSALGKNINEAFLFMIQHPLKTLQLLYNNPTSDHLYDGVKANFYKVFLYSGSFVLLYRPKYLIMFIPLIAQKMLNDNPNRWGIDWHYTIEIVSILSICLFLTINTIKNNKIKYALSILICISSAFISIKMFKVKNRIIPWTTVEKENFLSKKMYTPNFEITNAYKIHKYLETIPPDAKVVASNNLVPHFAFRKYIYLFPYVRDAEYIVLFDHDSYPLTPDQYKTELQKYLNNKDWTLIIEDYPLYILHSNSYQSP